MQLALEYSGLASEILSLIVLRECYVNIEVLADILTSNLLLEAGDKGTGTKLQRELLTLAALKSYAVEEALEVDNSGIAEMAALSSTEMLLAFLLRILSISASTAASSTVLVVFLTSNPL